MIVTVVQCRGTPYEIGLQQARLFAKTARGRIFRRRKTAASPDWFDRQTEEQFYAKFSPAIREEIAGIADALEVSMDRAYLFFGNGGIAPRLGGCSAVMTARTFGRNYDFQPQGYGARLAIIQPRGSNASIGFSELLTGRLDGMNEHGLSVALHLVGRTPIQRGMSCVLMTRIVLDQCSTTDEAIELFRRFPHAMRYNYSLLDAAGNAAVVEAAPGAFFARRGPALACTNHFQSLLMQPHNRARDRSSWTRLPPLEQWARQDLPAASMFAALNGSTSPAFFKNYDRGRSGTLHTLVTEPNARRVLIGIGGDATAFTKASLDIDFRDWLKGIDVAASQLDGQLGGLTNPYPWPRKRNTKTVGLRSA